MAERAFPIISVDDLPACRAFYEQLGFLQTFQFPPEGEPGFITMERGASSIGIGAGGDRVAGAPVVAQPVDQPWGERVAEVRDPASNLVYLGAPSLNATSSTGSDRRS